MAYWLMKSEPFKYSWDDLVREGQTRWDGVRNPMARNNLLAMKKGDEAFFYHSNEGMCLVGVMRIVEEATPDDTVTADKLTKDGRNPWVAVTVAPVKALAVPVPLARVKVDPVLQDMALLKYGRLSVQPVTPKAWQHILGLSLSA